MTLDRRFLLFSAAALVVAPGAATAQMRRDIVATAAAAGQFNTLLAAARAAGLAGPLQGPGPFTVFAPSDAAFARLPAGTVEMLLRPENRGQLAAILRYHVVPQRIAARDVPHDPTLVPTLNARSRVRAVRNRSGVRVDAARVVQADIQASNGIIHVIDRVLIPGQRHG